MTQPRILIACVGNIFLGDDAFGVEVARRLLLREPNPEVLVKDFGIRGYDLAYGLMDPYELVILVDACQRGGSHGSVYLLEPDSADDAAPLRVEPHGMIPTNALRMVKALNGATGVPANPGRMLIVGCEPADLGSEEEGKLGLSEIVLAAVDEAIVLIDRLVRKTLQGEPVEAAMQSN